MAAKQRTLHYFAFYGYDQPSERKALRQSSPSFTHTRLLHTVAEAREHAAALAAQSGLWVHVYKDTRKLFVARPSKSRNPIPTKWISARVRRIKGGRTQVELPIRRRK